MAEVGLTDEDMWHLLGVVVTDEEGGRISVGANPPDGVIAAERAGYLWLRPRGTGYRVEVTGLGRACVHRWAARKAKEAAHEFSRGW